tara:strand:+ start:1398 stop:1724 length:327 start_codon:yes stop_codon:yes gene_type:complete
MAIKAPGWCAQAVPTSKGWEDPDSGELFVSRKFAQADIDAFHGKVAKPAPAPKPAPVVEEEVVVEEPSLDLESMTKVELEAVGREHGVELDRREKKSSLLSKIKAIVE